MADFKNSKVLITGGCGFIGSNLARKLVTLGAKVELVDSLFPQYGGNLANIADIRNKVRFHKFDVRNTAAMTRLIKGKDYLFNLAGQTSHVDSMTDPYTDLEINASAQLSILETVRKYNSGLRVVFASTRQIYGRPQYLPVDEKHPIVPVDVNGINKTAGEWYHILYSHVYGIPCSVLRLTNTYGPGMRIKDARQTFLGIWIKNLIKGVPIQVFGNGLQLRDFNYVDDVVDAFIAAARQPKAVGKIMNLGSSEVINLKDLAKKMVAIAGTGHYKIVPFPPERKVIDIGDFYADFQLIRRLLGWKPKVKLMDGLKKTMAYYRLHGKAYWD